MTTGDETVDIMPDFDFVLDENESTVIEAENEKPAETETSTESTEEPTTETPEESTEETTKESELPEGADPNAYGIYQTMVDKNYLTPDANFKGTWLEVDDIFEQLPDRVFQGVIDNLNPNLKAVLEFGYSKENVSTEELAEFFQKTYVPEVDITTEEGQILFLTNELKTEGKEEEAADLIELWKEKGLLEARAKKYDETKKARAAKLQEEELTAAKQAKAAKQAQAKAFKQSITKEIEATEWKPARKQAVINEIFSGGMKTKSQEIAKHPKAFYQLADFLTYFDPKTGAFDLEAYTTQGLTPATQQVKSKIEKYFSTTSKAASPKTEVKKDEAQDVVYEFTDIT